MFFALKGYDTLRIAQLIRGCRVYLFRFQGQGRAYLLSFQEFPVLSLRS